LGVKIFSVASFSRRCNAAESLSDELTAASVRRTCPSTAVQKDRCLFLLDILGWLSKGTKQRAPSPAPILSTCLPFVRNRFGFKTKLSLSILDPKIFPSTFHVDLMLLHLDYSFSIKLRSSWLLCFRSLRLPPWDRGRHPRS
jgi:hypothetical protein